MDIHVVGNVVAVILQRRWIKRKQPDGGDPEILEIVELLRQSSKIADTVIIAVKKRADV